MKAKPAIDAVEHIIKTKKLMASLIKEEATVLSESLRISADADGGFGKRKKPRFAIILPSPSKDTFTQKTAHALSDTQHIIFVCTRYEGIDYRFEQYMKKKYPKQFQKISL